MLQDWKGKEERRDFPLFVLGINVGLRAGDFQSLRILQVYDGRSICQSVRFVEQKTFKIREFTFN